MKQPGVAEAGLLPTCWAFLLEKQGCSSDAVKVLLVAITTLNTRSAEGDRGAIIEKGFGGEFRIIR